MSHLRPGRTERKALNDNAIRYAAQSQVGAIGPAGQGGTAAEDLALVRDAARQDRADGGAEQVPPPGHLGAREVTPRPVASGMVARAPGTRRAGRAASGE